MTNPKVLNVRSGRMSFRGRLAGIGREAPDSCPVSRHSARRNQGCQEGTPRNPFMPVATGSYRESKLTDVFRQRLARFLELLPIRRVHERLVVLRECVLRVALFHEHITSCLQGICPVRHHLVGELELRRRARKTAVLRERETPRVVARRKARRELHGLCITKSDLLGSTKRNSRTSLKLSYSQNFPDFLDFTAPRTEYTA